MANIDISLVKINSPVNESLFSYLLGFVHPEKKERILKKRIKQDADNILTGEILAKLMIKKAFGIDISKENIFCNEYGKPCLSDYPDINFNISHSDKYIVCCVSGKPVGVDIQKIGRYNPSVVKKVCNTKEMKQIEESADKASEFTKLWTQKEAVLKMRGTGISKGDIKNCLLNVNVRSEKIEEYWLSVSE